MDEKYPNLERHLSELNAATELLTVQIPRYRALWDASDKSNKFWTDVSRFNPSARQLHATIQDAESHIGRFEWSSSTEWLDAVRVHRQQTANHLRVICTRGGFDLPANVDAGTPNRVLDSMHMAELMRSMYGPNWQLSLDQFKVLGPLQTSGPASTTPLAIFRPLIEADIKVILDHWCKLKTLMEQDWFKRFRIHWTQMSSTKRRGCLQHFFPQIRSNASISLYEILELDHSATRDVSARKGPPLSPFLTIEDLSTDNLLLDLLDVRAKSHPTYSLNIDAVFVRIGLCYKILPHIRIEGAMSFPRATSNSGEEYKIEWRDTYVPDTAYVSACVGVYNVRVQKQTYELFVRLATVLGTHENLLEVGKSLSDGYVLDDVTAPSTLDLSARSYLVNPDVMDCDFMQSLLKGWWDENLHDFWLLRTDPNTWHDRMQATARSSDGRTSNFLTPIFDRIDKFQALHDHVAVFRKGEGFAAKIELQAGEEAQNLERLESIISLHAAFRHVLNEAVTSLHKCSWHQRGCVSAKFQRLLDMLRSDDAMLRIIGLGNVMRVVERETQTPEARRQISLTTMRTFGDMSAIAACMQQTAKHDVLLPCPGLDYASTDQRFRLEWQDRPRPWMSLLSRTLAPLKPKQTQLDDLINRDTHLDEKHRTFWNTIDQYWPSDEVNKPLVEIILHCGPTTSSPRVEKPASLDVWITTVGVGVPTTTQIKKSKQKRQRPMAPSVEAQRTENLVQPKKQQPRPNIKLFDKAAKFWNDVKFGFNGVYDFENFSDALQSAGYQKIPAGGSIWRYILSPQDDSAPHSINFHDAHGEKKNLAFARRSWVNRIEGEVDVTIECGAQPHK